jgi:cytochrome oxidase Cu insertion factor (SCO1/SenC/PrrC family)
MTDTSHSQLQQSAAEPAPPAIGTAVPYFLALLLVIGMTYFGWTFWKVQQHETRRGQAIPNDVSGPPIKDFELMERSGEAFRSGDMRGRVWVATYFFTTCPGNCIRLNRNIQALHNLPELKDVTWVSITCDPDTDHLEELRAYAEHWKADPDRWLFCRADLDYTRRVAAGMNLSLRRQGHQDYAIVFDKDGKLRAMYNATSTRECELLRAKLLECLEEDARQELAMRSN